MGLKDLLVFCKLGFPSSTTPTPPVAHAALSYHFWWLSLLQHQIYWITKCSWLCLLNILQVHSVSPSPQSSPAPLQDGISPLSGGLPSFLIPILWTYTQEFIKMQIWSYQFFLKPLQKLFPVFTVNIKRLELQSLLSATCHDLLLDNVLSPPILPLPWFFSFHV